MVRNKLKQKFEFEQPINERQLQKLILNSLKELGLGGRWHFEHGYSHSNSSSQILDGKVSGCITSMSSLTADIADFTVYARKDETFEEPMFGSIEFRLPYGSISRVELFDCNIGRIYNVFEKNYQELLS